MERQNDLLSSLDSTNGTPEINNVPKPTIHEPLSEGVIPPKTTDTTLGRFSVQTLGDITITLGKRIAWERRVGCGTNRGQLSVCLNPFQMKTYRTYSRQHRTRNGFVQKKALLIARKTAYDLEEWSSRTGCLDKDQACRLISLDLQKGST